MQKCSEKKLKAGKKAFRLHLLLSGPPDLHQRSNSQGHFAHRNLATQDRKLLNWARCDEADATLTNIVNAPAKRNNAQLPARPKFGERLDRQFKALGEPRFTAALGLGCESHANQSLRHCFRYVNSSDGLVPCNCGAGAPALGKRSDDFADYARTRRDAHFQHNQVQESFDSV